MEMDATGMATNLHANMSANAPISAFAPLWLRDIMNQRHARKIGIGMKNVPFGVELPAQDEHLQRGVQPAEGVDAVGDSGERGVV